MADGLNQADPLFSRSGKKSSGRIMLVSFPVLQHQQIIIPRDQVVCSANRVKIFVTYMAIAFRPCADTSYRCLESPSKTLHLQLTGNQGIMSPKIQSDLSSLSLSWSYPNCGITCSA